MLATCGRKKLVCVCVDGGVCGMEMVVIDGGGGGSEKQAGRITDMQTER